MEELKHAAAIAMFRSPDDPWQTLLSPSASSNLMNATKYVRENAAALGYSEDSEMAVNLDQDVTFAPHIGRHLPCVLASTSTMWLLNRKRPMTPKEQYNL